MKKRVTAIQPFARKFPKSRVELCRSANDPPKWKKTTCSAAIKRIPVRAGRDLRCAVRGRRTIRLEDSRGGRSHSSSIHQFIFTKFPIILCRVFVYGGIQ